jgi:hypothetical protein
VRQSEYEANEQLAAMLDAELWGESDAWLALGLAVLPPTNTDREQQ